jgi:Na+-driven multidrug efflux pump
MSALVSATTNLTIAIITAYVGTAGVAALAGYGAGARLEFILVPFTYGIGGPAGILIGTNIGASQGGRALRTAWITLLLSALATEAIGLAAATWPAAWIGSFSDDPAVLAIGTTYLRIVGPFFGFFGIGYALYCAGQGTGRMEWPVAGAVTRAAIAVVGGAAAIRLGERAYQDRYICSHDHRFRGAIPRLWSEELAAVGAATDFAWSRTGWDSNPRDPYAPAAWGSSGV